MLISEVKSKQWDSPFGLTGLLTSSADESKGKSVLSYIANGHVNCNHCNGILDRNDGSSWECMYVLHVEITTFKVESFFNPSQHFLSIAVLVSPSFYLRFLIGLHPLCYIRLLDCGTFISVLAKRITTVRKPRKRPLESEYYQELTRLLNFSSAKQ